MARSLRSDTGTPPPPVAGHVRVLASATLQDVMYHPTMLNHLNFLRRIEHSVSLQLRRRRYDPEITRQRSEFLEGVLSLPSFKHISNDSGQIFEIEKVYGSGYEWRRRPDGLPPLPFNEEKIREMFGVQDLSNLDSVPVGRLGLQLYVEDSSASEVPHTQDSQRFLLIVHTWGPDTFQLVGMPKWPGVAGPSALQPARCALCRAGFDPIKNRETLCIFHPGSRYFADSESSSSSGLYANSPGLADEEGSSSSGSDADPEDLVDGKSSCSSGSNGSTGSGNFDDCRWSCCHLEHDEPGCMIDTRHVTAEEVSSTFSGNIGPGRGRRSWRVIKE